ncbi:hypothetical protein H8B13_06685 [Hymenobacter sp. BT188]|uniref:hypothetical protein n=1 Tax=Hymenobacter sp. BT188 TaxID=2763504 RepID=UPI001650F21E|nr:hypothetical protein [Hymenobacter sp. BT188]MBC6606497.1 hypothetical protein [Hymenobacter sp. BT188]
MRISRTIKRLWNAVASLLLSSVCLFVSFLAFKNAYLDLSKLDVVSGQVVDTGVMVSSITTSKGRIDSQIYFVKIAGVNQILAVYYPSQNYHSLQHAIQVGDSISVYYQNTIDTQKPNLSTYQINKGARIILDQAEYRNKERNAGYMASLGALMIAGLGVWQDRKYWKHPKKSVYIKS